MSYIVHNGSFLTHHGVRITLGGGDVVVGEPFLKKNVPAIIIAKDNVAFEDTGITRLNTAIVYNIEYPGLMYIPGSTISTMTVAEKDEPYLIKPLKDMDLSEFFI